MNTQKFLKKQDAMTAQCVALTLSGASFKIWDSYRVSFFNSLKGNVSQRRYTSLMQLFTSLYTANFNQNTIYVYIDADNNKFTTQKSNIANSYLYKLPTGETISTTEQLHDRVPHITADQWEAMDRKYYSKISGNEM